MDMTRPAPVLLVLACAFLALGNTCGGGDSDGGGGDVGPSLSEPLAGAARAGVITDSSELLSGRLAKGKLGDLRIYNGRVAFVIESPGPSDGYNPWGGGVLDAALVGGDGSLGPTWFGELLSGVNTVGIEADAVDVLADGSDGGPAVIRAVGHGSPFEMLGDLLDPDELRGAVWIEYSLAPGADALKMTIGYDNTTTAPVDILRVEMGFLMGDGATPFVPGAGFDLGEIQGGFDWYGAFADDVGYQISWTDGGFTHLLAPIGVEIAYVPGDTVAPDATLERTFEIRVAPPGASPASGPQVVTGQVVTADGDPAAGRRIDAYVSGRHQAFGITDEQGKATLSVPDGEVFLRVGETVGEGTLVTLAPEGTLSFSVTDSDGAPLPARIEVSEAESGARLHRISAAQGDGTVELPAGRYHVVIGRGFEYTVAEQTVEIVKGGEATVTVALERVVDTTGWVSSDFHLHAEGSPDSNDSNEYKVSALAAEGVEVPVSTDHDNIVDWQPAVLAMGLQDHVRMITGEEVTTYAYGHFNVFPLVPDPEGRNAGAFRWYRLPPEVMLGGVREGAPTGHVIQINHPRATRFGGYMTAVGFEPESGKFTRPDLLTFEFDAMEVTNGKRGEGAVQSEGFRDWVGLLAHGKRVAGTGNSDSHHALSSLVGFPRNYVKVGKDAPAEVTAEDVASAVHALDLTICAGPFITAAPAGAPGEIAVKVQAPPWVAVDRVQVVVDGAVTQTLQVDTPTEDVVRFDEVVTVDLSGDAFVIMVAEGDSDMAPLYPGREPFGFTNPLFIDHDGDGSWTPPLGAFDGL